MNKRLIGVFILCLASALVYAQNFATDRSGANVINHSNGVLTFSLDKLQNVKNVCSSNSDGGLDVCLNKYAKTVKHYTTVAQYPTTFVPNTVSYDAGCQKYTMTETPVLTGRATEKPLYCTLEVPFASLDAGTFQVYRDTDGGYGLSQCPARAALPTTAWPGFCFVQQSIAP